MSKMVVPAAVRRSSPGSACFSTTVPSIGEVTVMSARFTSSAATWASAAAPRPRRRARSRRASGCLAARSSAVALGDTPFSTSAFSRLSWSGVSASWARAWRPARARRTPGRARWPPRSARSLSSSWARTSPFFTDLAFVDLELGDAADDLRGDLADRERLDVAGRRELDLRLRRRDERDLGDLDLTADDLRLAGKVRRTPRRAATTSARIAR